MSSPSPLPFWCHSCRSLVHLHPSPDLACPLCSDGFVEEFVGPAFDPGLPALFVATSADLLSPGRRLARRRSITNDILSQLSSPSAAPASASSAARSLPDASDMLWRSSRRSPAEDRSRGSLDLVDRVQSLFLRSGGGRRSRSPDGGGIGGGTGRRPLDVRDFFLGPAGELLIQQLIQGDAERHGSGPASKDAVDSLPTLTISKQTLEADEIHCAVCKEAFEIGGKVREMPCKHMYHSDCILPWLELHSSCPICRHELPSENASGSQPRRSEENSLLVGSRMDGFGGERGLAIVGIPGVGIHVRSIVLFGVGRNEGLGSINGAGLADTISLDSNAVHSAPLSSDSGRAFTSHIDVAAPVNEGGDAGIGRSPAFESVNMHLHRDQGPMASRRSRGLFSWLFPRSSSNHQSASSTRRRRRSWFS